MKRVLNKFIFLFIVSITMIFTSSKVFAVIDEDKLGKGGPISGETYTQVHDYYVLKQNDADPYKYSMGHHITYYDGAQTDIYCIDTCMDAGGVSADLKVWRQLDPKKPLDAAVLHVISSGAYYPDILIAVRALETFFSDFRNAGSDCADGMANYRMGILWAIENSTSRKNIIDILDIDTNQYDVSTASKLEEYLATRYGRGHSSYFNNKRFYLVKVDAAKKLFMDGIQYGAEVARGKHLSDKEVTFTKPVFNKTDIDVSYVEGDYEPRNTTQDRFHSLDEGFQDLTFITAGNNNKYYNEFNKYIQGRTGTSNANKTYIKSTKEVQFSATFKKFDDATPIGIDISNTSNVRIDTGTIYFFDTESDSWKVYTKEELTKVIAKHFTNQNQPDMTINFKYNVTSYVPVTALSSGAKIQLKIYLYADYFDETFLSGALIYNKTHVQTQRFFIYDKNRTTHEGKTFILDWDLTADFCYAQEPNISNTDEFKSYLKICCRGENQEGFNIHDECESAVNKYKSDEDKAKARKENKWCQKEKLYCSVCDGTISVPQVCSEFGDGDIPKCDDNADAIVEDNNNIKLCVLDYSDLAKNKYKMTTDGNVARNEYCNVYCKEDYKISLPLGRWVTSGRSFTVGLNVSGTKTCYTDLINHDKFMTDITEQKQKLDANILDSTAREKYSRILNEYRACTEASWSSDIKFNPKITITYDEKEYIQKFENHKLEFVQGKTKDGTTYTVSNDNKWLCNGTDVDNYYNQCISGNAVDDVSNTDKETLSGYYDPSTFQKTNIIISKVRFAKKASFASSVYVPKDNLYIKAGTGEVVQNVDSSTYMKLATELDVDGQTIKDSGQLPVSLKRENGRYKFNIQFNNIGEFFDTGETGRLVGGKKSVALSDGNTTLKGEYICSYIVNCPECSTEGFVPPFDEEITVTTPDTEVPKKCIVCSVDTLCIDYCDSSNGLFITRQVSLNNINPSNRAYGINLAGLKGRTAVSSIEKAGETIYNGNDGKAEYTVILTPSETRKLQQYNNVKLDSGGYTSFDDFECVKYSDYVGKSSQYYDKLKENDYLVCTSKLLHGELGNQYELKEIEFSDNVNYSWIEACDKETQSKCFMGGFYGPAYK